MINEYPTWKYLLLIVTIVVGGLYALPNLYGEDPAVQISALRGSVVDDAVRQQVSKYLQEAGIAFQPPELTESQLLVRFGDTDVQLQARDLIAGKLGSGYIVAVNLAATTPAWLQAINALPMYLGLDLRGGVHFLMEVDMAAVSKQTIERYRDDLRTLLRDAKIRYTGLRLSRGSVVVEAETAEILDQTRKLIGKEYPSLILEDRDVAGSAQLIISLSEQEKRDIRDFAVKQNLTALRNRVNELGVAEPIIQQQGQARIVVQLPGVQDTARAKRILGATATLEYRAVDYKHNLQEVIDSGRVPAGSRLYDTRDGAKALLKNRAIVTGDQIINARSGFDQQTGSPMVSVTLDGKGARKMLEFTKDNVGNPMAVVYLENKSVTEIVDGKPVITSKTVEEVINLATIRGVFGKNFQTTGLDSPQEAHELALLLRAGALAAPIQIIEERTIGPTMGKENIQQGFKSVVVGFWVVLVFMALYYRVFGLVADVALALNVVLIMAILSMLQATLTMPGIAGIVLTVGMAVDANVLIYERIREELRNGNSPQASIHAGYEKAFGTIADANVTTLIAALVLFGFGTGPIKGFAVTLSIGILTSMFTAIMGTRAVINLIYGGRRAAKLAI